MKRLLILVAVIAVLGDGAFAANDQEDKEPAASDKAAPASQDETGSKPPRKREIPYAETGAIGSQPLDIPDEKGLYIYSKDHKRAVRMYLSLRMLAVWDDRQNFHAIDLNLPQISTGADDFRDVNSIWSADASRFGLDVMVNTGVEEGVLGRMEFDFKGTDEKFRLRHAYAQNRRWVVGQPMRILV